MEKLIPAAEAAAALGIVPDTLTNWRCWGRGPRFIKTSPTRRGKVLYRVSDIEAWQEANLHSSTAEFDQ